MESKINLSRPRVGIVGPFSGSRAAYGQLLREIIQKTDLPKYVDILWGDDKAISSCSHEVAHALSKENPLAVIGHFNSDSALAASEVYRIKNIPLLLPASTALTLSDIPLIYRICPNDQEQINKIIDFINYQAYPHIAIWTDNSPYSLRLKNLLLKNRKLNQSPLASLKNNDALIMLGSQHTIAESIIKFKNDGRTFTIICCDDCSIEAFKKSIDGIKNVFFASPYPDFSDCIKIAANLIISYIKLKLTESFHSWLACQNDDFINQQYRHSFFEVRPIA